ncbi:diacylglycerol kinase [Streptomyces sp. NBC_01343]|uniref:Diacylglycerol kinase n=1 Tax=Streptomyces flavotricini TaxID=66888 RepID=A0ABS8E8U4_9ACTN|nr:MULTISPECIES: diacylglycerol kinase [Streptomyces]MCC0096952.1 diacylglycerol kinase [Streptomyces flavotricini]WSI28888.1 diacylglycerol kinase [Streptomyces sp. NBC_01343]
MSHAGAPVGGLLVLVDPVARRLDGESVRIAKDVLSAGAAAKICLPDSQEEFARALARRGHRQPVIVGDDRALVRAVGLLYRERGLGDGAVSLIPVGQVGSLGLARTLGVPLSAVAAARSVLDGAVRTRDLLVDDSDGVVLGDLRIPPVRAAARPSGPSVWSAYRSLVRTLVPPGARVGHRLRVEADGQLLVDVDRVLEDLRVVPASSSGGVAEVTVRLAGGPSLRVKAASVTVSGSDFRYRADALVAGPVRRRTWTLLPGAWSLTLPR